MPFVKGKSGNPSGRPKADMELRALARSYTAADYLDRVAGRRPLPGSI